LFGIAKPLWLNALIQRACSDVLSLTAERTDRSP
jgi:hypothetical protein